MFLYFQHHFVIIPVQLDKCSSHLSEIKRKIAFSALENFWDNCDPPTDLELISEWLVNSAVT